MKNLPVCIVFMLVLFSPVIGQVQDSDKFLSLLPTDFHQAYLNDDKPILIDVREFFEYRKSRINGAVNIPSSGNLKISADTIDKGSSLYVYCTSGFRSRRVAKYFCDEGFSKVINLEGGITTWKDDGMEVEKKHLRKKQ
jgi:rhodanese-related sulfurtransferase